MSILERNENNELNETTYLSDASITACEANMLYEMLFGESKKSKRSGNNGIRDLSRSSSRHSHFGNNRISPKNRRALDRNLRRHTKLINKTLASQCGQSTVEYAVVAVAVLSIVVALGFLANIFRDGVAIQHALGAASHHLSMGFGGVQDVFAY